jgi:carboxylate-amine ligase
MDALMPSLTMGIEEEYLLVDRSSRALVTEMPARMLEECNALCGDQQVSPELLRAQIEIGTRICGNIAEAREALTDLRRIVVEVADSHGLAPIAASTHPFARWADQQPTAKERYAMLTDQMQAAARRLLICGMHVHIGIEDDELRIDLMNQLSYFLPHLLALSCSSPFWEGQNTGLKSYRLTVFDALPRTGLPERFASYAEYERHVQILIDAGLMEDATTIWWDLRPSARYPTLETRVMDVCTSVDDALCIAAFIQCLLRMLYRLRIRNHRWRTYTNMLVNENRWRAIRYGHAEGLIDFAKGTIVPFEELVDELLILVEEDAEALGCQQDLAHCRGILGRGNSAERQLKVYDIATAEGAEPEEALRAVVDHLIVETRPKSDN